MRRIFAALLILFTASVAIAQDRPNTILVLDASGSMWGQIDGVAKITIAQEVVTNLLDTIPDNQRLGLTVYGHRERGNCADIETIVAPAEGTRDAIAAAVAGIKPLGKTPMTYAVTAAAEALRYTEDSATVILISDGVETCAPDPCEAARLLEEAGIDFTAHVIGFDINDADALAQMQCLAGETGGQFLTAANAAELSEALTTVTVAPEPVMVSATLEARIGDESGPLVDDPLLWSISTLFTDEAGNPFEADVPEGTYELTGYRVIDEMAVTATIAFGETPEQVVTLVFPEPTPEVTLDAPDTAPAGSTITVTVSGDMADGDYVQIDPGNDGPATYTYLRGATSVELVLPAQTGEFEITYIRGSANILQSRPITITPAELALEFPESVPAGATFEVRWAGPNQKTDNIQIGEVGGGYSDYTYTERGNPVSLIAPATPGTYEIRYRFRDRETILAMPIIVAEAEVSLNAPDTVTAGADFDVTWAGPDASGDNVQIAEIGGRYLDYTYTARGNPVTLTAPSTPGDYELRYAFRDRETIATRPITVTDVGAALTAPDTAIAGATITVGWDGPDYANDYIGIAAISEDRAQNYTRTNTGNPLDLVTPTEPGEYEIRYYLNQDQSIIARRPITLTKVEGALTAPDTATAGESIPVGWDGPDYANDYISVRAVGDDRDINYTRTNAGNPLDLVLPTEPGEYVIQYVLNQDRSVLVTRPITVTDVGAALTAPDTAVAGATVIVGWDGPDYANDYIAVRAAGEDRDINYTRTNTGNPLDLVMPTEPGDYEIHYILNQDRQSIASRTISLSKVEATLDVPAQAVAGADVTINWTGPDYANDYIGVARVGEDGQINYTRTNTGNPLTLTMPTEAGDYEVRYVLNQDRRVIGRAPVALSKVTAQLVAPPSGPAGGAVLVGWDGPDYANDYIAISDVGDDGQIAYSRTNTGNPVSLTLPDSPGEYELRYVLNQDRSVIARIPFTVTAAE